MSEQATPFDVMLAIGAIVLAGANTALLAATDLEWLVIATGVVGVALLVAITVRFYQRYSGGAGLVLFATGWVIVMLVGFVLSAAWPVPNGASGSSHSRTFLESISILIVLTTSVPLIMCGLGLLFNVAVSQLRGEPYGRSPATH